MIVGASFPLTRAFGNVLSQQPKKIKVSHDVISMHPSLIFGKDEIFSKKHIK